MNRNNIIAIANDAVQNIISYGKNNCYILISCTKKKLAYAAAARTIYSSLPFKESVAFAEHSKIRYGILSAKFGLLDPDLVIEPYDATLKGASKEVKALWGEETGKAILRAVPPQTTLVFLAGEDYASPLEKKLGPLGYRLIFPMRHLSQGFRLGFLRDLSRLQARAEGIITLYGLFERLAHRFGLRTLDELVSTPLPQQGVYFFFDRREQTRFSRLVPRLVRVGTHAISAGSKSTLKSRLRAHLGLNAGGGNHRASVFRLHVGRAFIEKLDLQREYPQWGLGQSAIKDVSAGEADLELKVSDYLRNLLVLYMPIIDAAAKTSARADVESFVISLMTENFAILDPPSSSWLGKHSDRAAICSSGLWNVRGVGTEADLNKLPALEQLTEAAMEANFGTIKYAKAV